MIKYNHLNNQLPSLLIKHKKETTLNISTL